MVTKVLKLLHTLSSKAVRSQDFTLKSQGVDFDLVCRFILAHCQSPELYKWSIPPPPLILKRVLLFFLAMP